VKIEKARCIAEKLTGEFSPYCERIKIAGSIRRRKPEVKDIEIVAIPRIEYENDLFGDATIPHNLLLEYLNNRCGEWSVFVGGERYKKIRLYEGIMLDLFMVLPPAQWGVIYMIRTGPAEFSKKIATPRRKGGLLPSDCHVKNGAVWWGGEMILMPEERNFFDFLGLQFIMPSERR